MLQMLDEWLNYAGLQVSAFEAANVSLILYTSIMHAGHSPAWENGSLAAAHPEFSERDENGACPSL